MYRVYFQEVGDKLYHNGQYEKKKDALRFYMTYQKNHDLIKSYVVKIHKNGEEEIIVAYHKK